MLMLFNYIKLLNQSSDLVSPLLGIHPRQMKTYVYTETRITMFLAALFILAQTGNNSNVY